MVFNDQELLCQSEVELSLNFLGQVEVYLQSRYFRMQGVDAVLDCCSKEDVVDDDAGLSCCGIYDLQAEALRVEQIFII